MSSSRKTNREGAMLVLIAVTLPLVVIMAAFAVDVARMQLVNTELRTATDAASRAGAKALSLHQTETAAREAAQEAASRNRVAGTPLVVRDREVEIGLSRQATRNSRFVFTPDADEKNAVRVTGSRTAASAGGPVSLFLGQVMGVNSFEPSRVATATQLDRDLCLVVDRSGSMMRDLVSRNVPGGNCNPPHPTRSRWGGLDAAVDGFLSELEETAQLEQCGLVSYSNQGTRCGFTFTTSDINVPLSFDLEPIHDEMDHLGSQAVAGRTNISSGIDNGIRVLTDPRARPFALKSMVLMTDGRHNTGPEPVISARRAVAEDIVIHTVTFSSEADFRRMRDVADVTGGKHFHAPDAEALERIFREIASTLPVILTD
ncbi:MAG: VWA domain-containing protein [Pirellulales bacterium]|nr:VWA domain-containing protein [Pirellulales bacterium]